MLLGPAAIHGMCAALLMDKGSCIHGMCAALLMDKGSCWTAHTMTL